jgi:hypothetical protein
MMTKKYAYKGILRRLNRIATDLSRKKYPYRRVLCILAVALPLVLVGCEKDEKTSYQVFNKTEKSTYALDKYLDGSLWEVVVFCYIGDNIVRQDNFERIAPGEKSEIREVPDNFEKIKISFKPLPKQSQFYELSSNARSYTVSYTLLSKDNNTIAEISGKTMVSKTLKSYSSQYELYEEKNEWKSVDVLLRSFQNKINP